MGAGSQTDHYIQDATEQDLVYRVQELLVRDNFAVTDNVEIKKKEFDELAFPPKSKEDLEIERNIKNTELINSMKEI